MRPCNRRKLSVQGGGKKFHKRSSIVCALTFEFHYQFVAIVRLMRSSDYTVHPCGVQKCPASCHASAITRCILAACKKGQGQLGRHLVYDTQHFSRTHQSTESSADFNHGLRCDHAIGGNFLSRGVGKHFVSAYRLHAQSFLNSAAQGHNTWQT